MTRAPSVFFFDIDHELGRAVAYDARGQAIASPTDPTASPTSSTSLFQFFRSQ